MKRLVSFIFVLSSFFQYAMAQFDIEAFKTPAQQMVEKGVTPAIFLVRSSFLIKNNETGKRYGSNGRNEFGEQTSFGIKIKDGLFLSDYAIRPWEYNEKYPKYKKDYTPILNTLQYSEFGTEHRFDSLVIKSDDCVSLCDSSFYYYKSDVFNGNGLPMDNNMGIKSGWILWVTVSKKTDGKGTANPVVIVQQNNVEVTKEQNSFELVSPKTDNDIIGGLFVAPDYSRIGSVDFHLIGIIKMKNNKWELTCPFGSIEKVTQPEKELTPIEELESSDKKNKKTYKEKKK